MQESKPSDLTTPRSSERYTIAGRPSSGTVAAPHDARKRVIVVGAPQDVPRAIEHPAVAAGRLVIVSALAVDVEASETAPELSLLAEMLTVHEAGSILVAGPVGPKVIQRIADLALLHHCDLLAVMPTESVAGHRPLIVWSGDSPLVQLAHLPQHRWEFAAKRGVDIAFALLGLLLAAPILAFIAVIVLIEGKGTVLFRHERVGRRGRPFSCLKIRTMRMDAEEQLRRRPELYEEYRRNHFKIPEDRDPRTTRIGRFLRRTSLDELPQLWNVLVGDMSVVGPRPVVREELSLYENSSELLLSIRPGITGAWAVNGRHAVGYPQRCGLELQYVRTWTLRGDVGILFRTLGAIVHYSGASS